MYSENIKGKVVFYIKDRRRVKKKHFPFWRSAQGVIKADSVIQSKSKRRFQVEGGSLKVEG